MYFFNFFFLFCLIQEYNKWVICRVYERNGDDDNGTELSCLDEVFLSLDDDLDEISLPNY